MAILGNVTNDVVIKFGGATTWTQVSANSTSEQSVTVYGLKTTDLVGFPNKPTHQTGLGIVGARVSAANTLAITFMNNTGSGITPTANETYYAKLSRFELPARTDFQM